VPTSCELVSLRARRRRRAHGTTTTAMIAFCLIASASTGVFFSSSAARCAARRQRPRRQRPARRRGRRVRPFRRALRPRCGAPQRRSRPPHRVRVEGGGGAAVATGSLTSRRSMRGEELEPVALELAVPGAHNRRNAAAALAASSSSRRARGRRADDLEFTGVGAASSARRGPARRGRRHYATNRRRSQPRSQLPAMRSPTGGRSSSSSSAPLLADAAPRARVRRRARDRRPVAVTGDLSGPRAVDPRVTGKLIVDALSDRRPETIGWTPALETRAHPGSRGPPGRRPS